MLRYQNQEIERVLDERYNLTLVPPKASMFIKSNGRFLDLDETSHTEATELLVEAGFPSTDIEFHSELKHMGWLRASLLLGYVELPKVLPTSAQFYSLLEVIDAAQAKKGEQFTVYGFNGEVHRYAFSDRGPDEILKLIKRFYSSGVFYESLRHASNKCRGEE